MIYPKNFENKIGFENIRQLIKKHCLSSLGAKFVDKIRFSESFNIVNKWLQQVNEFVSIVELGENFPVQDYFDLTPELERIRIEGTVIEIEQLFNLKTSLSTISNCLNFFKKSAEENYPFLKEIALNVFLENEIIIKTEKIINHKGNIKDYASSRLREIRMELISKQKNIGKKLHLSLKSAKNAGWIETDAEPTIRNGRLVIPVSATNKRKIKGFIHDESASGKTVFIEPTEVFDTNNEIRELENAEIREITKILAEFTVFIRPYIEDLKNAYNFLGLMDFIRAKAKFSFEINAGIPALKNQSIISWKNAVHPLLFLSHKKHNKTVVPFDLELDNKKRILIISGPNAGGKSVCLMSVGLIQYMLQCGLAVPINEDSFAGIFDNIFVDIGDEQSLENDLSTYSSHLLNIKYFVNNSNSKTLFLIDEFGTGTEPQFGGAIAESVLEELNKNKSFGVVTTHYANLKLLADNNPGIINGAMLFDSKIMKPLYKLKVGKPGSSFAFEIARQIGFPENLLKNSAIKTGTTQLDFDTQLQQLEIEKDEIEKKQIQLNVADELLSELIEKYENLTKQIKVSKEQIVKKARDRAIEILGSSNKLIENTIREIRETQAEKEKTKKLRKKIKSHKEKIIFEGKNNKTKISKEIQEKVDTEIEKGDYVKIKGQNIIGEVTEISDSYALVSFDTFKIRSSFENLTKASNSEIKHSVRKASNKTSSIINDKLSNFKLSIDVRGKRAEEVLTIINQYIDDAVLLNTSEISILHGKGNGILRKVIRDHLKSIKEVKSYKDSHPDRGGHGITIVNFR
ncbi:MAG: Smr/MutS family protein [Bacteroidales bacterium]|nr:Smr/MutS family protein [Bacteroidales bacterium]